VKFFLGKDICTSNTSAFVEYRKVTVGYKEVDVNLDGLWSGISLIF